MTASTTNQKYQWPSETGGIVTGYRAVAINPGDCGGVIEYDPCTTGSFWLMFRQADWPQEPDSLEWVDPAKLIPSPFTK